MDDHYLHSNKDIFFSIKTKLIVASIAGRKWFCRTNSPREIDKRSSR